MITKLMTISLCIITSVIIGSALTFAQTDTTSDWGILLKQAETYSRTGKSDSALICAKQALAIARSANGDSDSSVAMSWHRISGLAITMDLPNTDSLFRETFAAWGRVKNANQVEFAKTLSNYGGWLTNKERFVESIAELGRCLEIRNKLLEAGNPDICRTESKLGYAYFHSGRPADAVAHFKIADQCFSANPKSTPTQKADANAGLARAYYTMSQFSRSEKYYKLAIAQSATTNEKDRTATYLAQLAAVYYSSKKYSVSDSIALLALKLIDYPNLDSSNKSLWIPAAEALNNRGLALYLDHRFDEAESCLVQSLRIKQVMKTHSISEVLRTQYSLANLYRDVGNYTAAESLYIVVLSGRRKALKPPHRDIAYALESLARLYSRTGRYEVGFDSALVACKMRAEIIDRQDTLLEESELLQYSDQLRASSDLCLSIAMESGLANGERNRQLSGVVLRTKGFVSDFIFSRALKTSSSDAWETSRILKKVSAMIPEGSVCIEYIHFSQSEMKGLADSLSDGGFYAALVINRNGDSKIVNLGKGSEIDSLVGMYQDHMNAMSIQRHSPTIVQRDEFVTIGRAIYSKVISPLESMIGSTQTIFVAPDGQLNSVSFATLVDGLGKYLVESHEIHYLSAGRDLLRARSRPKASGDLIAFADPDFDADPKMRLTSPEKSAIGTTLVPNRTRSLPDDCLYVKRLHVSSLPNTRKEAQAVGSLWDRTYPGHTKLFTGAESSEDNLKRVAPTATVLYIASHGFFVDTLCARHANDDESGDVSSSLAENPLLQSGLLLAGANLSAAQSRNAGVEDGVVSAAEIADLDLKRTNLVVLSACESALGKVEAGEGVYGLRRAFLLAGAGTVISALWKIDDKTTAEMMGQLFSKASQSIPGRIRSVQLAQLQKQRAEKSSDHPYSWGAFIATGDWR